MRQLTDSLHYFRAVGNFSQVLHASLKKREMKYLTLFFVFFVVSVTEGQEGTWFY